MMGRHRLREGVWGNTARALAARLFGSPFYVFRREALLG